MGTYVIQVKGWPIQVYGKTRRQAQLARDYIERCLDKPDLSEAGKAARMQNALYEARQKK